VDNIWAKEGRTTRKIKTWVDDMKMDLVETGNMIVSC
jgi:hypothetical protein